MGVQQNAEIYHVTYLPGTLNLLLSQRRDPVWTMLASGASVDLGKIRPPAAWDAEVYVEDFTLPNQILYMLNNGSTVHVGGLHIDVFIWMSFERRQAVATCTQ